MIAELQGTFRAFNRIKENAVTEFAFLGILDLHRGRYICTFKDRREDSERFFRQISDCHILIQ